MTMPRFDWLQRTPATTPAVFSGITEFDLPCHLGVHLNAKTVD